MISKLSRKLTEKLCENNTISNDEFDLYNYGIFIVISEILLFAYCLVVGAVVKIALPSLLFCVFFFLVHRFAGGVHAKTELHCLMITLSSFFISIITIKQITHLNWIYLCFFYVCCFIVLIILSPADTPQKPLTKKEKILFKKITTLIIVVGFVAIAILKIIDKYLYANAIIVAVGLQSLSVVCGRLFNKKLLTNNT